MTNDTNYYHAGTQLSEDNVYWSNHTRMSRGTAVLEAKRLAKKRGGTGIVEYWDRSQGMRPGDPDVVIDAFFVEESKVR